ncbi:MAG: PDZ domain-containing protein [Candidatus Aminicenantes bacterium]|nr:MAG: PDZ domain-containing protein [Candidatus Aminicenantes bacterium]
MKRLIVLIFIILLVFFATNVKAQTDSDISKFESEVKQILKRISPSIFKVVAENHKKNFAAGIAIDNRHVVSNIKVIHRPYAGIYIETVNGKKFTARVVGKDKYSSLILLKIDKNVLTPIKHARAYEVGDWIALVGAFYKEFPSIYHGILSSALEDQLILNAPVTPGSSGGAVVNKKGELIGVIRGPIGFAFDSDYTFKDHSGEIHIEAPKSQHKDLCAAVPVEKVVDVTNDLIKYGKVRRGWLGVLMDLKDDKVEITNININSPAEKAGLRPKDVILKINGKPIDTTKEVVNLVRSFKPEQKVKIEVLRGKARESALVVIGELKEGKTAWKYPFPSKSSKIAATIPERLETLPRAETFVYHVGGQRKLGVEVMNLTPDLAKEFNIKEGTGLMISKVSKNTAAEKAGFRAGDVIVKAGNKPITKNSDLRNALNELQDDEAVVIEVYRKGKRQKIKVVPDKIEGFGVIFDKFRDKLKDFNIRIDEEKKEKIEEAVRRERQKLQETREKYLQEMEMIKKKELEKYKAEIEKMRQEQEKMRQEMEKLKQSLEKEKEKKEKETTTDTI